jgi:hypothetical protein
MASRPNSSSFVSAVAHRPLASLQLDLIPTIPFLPFPLTSATVLSPWLSP